MLAAIYARKSTEQNGVAEVARARVVVVCLALFVAGCAGVYRPPTGTVWAFTADSIVTLSIGPWIVVARSESQCAAMRETFRTSPNMMKESPVARLRECRQVEVGGGTVYWLFSLPPTNIAAEGDMQAGAAKRETCEAIRRDSTGLPVWMRLSPCTQTWLRFP